MSGPLIPIVAPSSGTGFVSLIPASIANVPSQAINGVTGRNNAISGIGNTISSGAAGLATLPDTPQYFFTVPFANNQAVLYKFQLNPNTLTPDTAIEFIFPLTPSNVTKQVVNLSNYYDVRGSAASFGVQRIIDQFGLTPPIITISGSTGFQFHSLDGYQWSGKASFARLVGLIQYYSNLVASASASSQPTRMPELKFFDGFTGEVYNVTPFNQQAYSMDASRPIIQNYNLQFIAQESFTPVVVGLQDQDAFVQAFVIAKALLTEGALSITSQLTNILPGGNIV